MVSLRYLYLRERHRTTSTTSIRHEKMLVLIKKGYIYTLGVQTI